LPALTVIVAVPVLLAITTPLLSTVATRLLLDVQITSWLVALMGRTVAVSVRVWPTFKSTDVEDTLTPVTGIFPCVHLAYNLRLPVTANEPWRCTPPLAAVNQPAKLNPLLVGVGMAGAGVPESRRALLLTVLITFAVLPLKVPPCRTYVTVRLLLVTGVQTAS